MYVAVYKSGAYQYCRLTESYRDENGKVKTKIIKNFGRVDLLLKNDPDALEKLKAQYGGSLHEKMEERGKLRSAKLRSFISSEQKLPSPEAFPSLNYGYFVLRSLWKELRLDRMLETLKNSKLKIEFDLNAVASFMAFSKVLDPHSVRYTFYDHDLFIADPLKGISLQNCYDTLELLYKYKDKILRTVNRGLDDEYGEERSLLIFYDVTNAYFESPLTYEERGYKQKDYQEKLEAMIKQARKDKELPDSLFKPDGSLKVDFELLPESFLSKVRESKIEYLRMRGPSKEHRFDLPLVSVALIIDKNGFPMDFEIYSGDSSEFKTMSKSIEKFEAKYHTNQTIVVADRGLNSASNLKMLQDKGYGFLMAQKVSAFPEELQQKMLELDKYTRINAPAESDERYRIIHDYGKLLPGEQEPLNCTLVLTYNEQRRARDEEVLERQIEKVQKQADRKAKINPSSSSCAELALVEGKDKTARVIGVDQDAVEKRRARCGFAAMVYKPAPVKEGQSLENKLDDDAIAGVYHQLNKIEECFKIRKSNLGLRPMYVWNQHHICGHVLVCVLALILLRMLQARLKDDLLQKPGIGSLCQALNDARVTFMKPSASECVFIPNMSRVDHIRRQRPGYTEKELLAALENGSVKSEESIISRCMRAVNLIPVRGIVNRPDLAHCLRTRFDSDEDVVSPLLLRQLYPSLYTTIAQK